MKGHMRGAFRQNSKQGSLRGQHGSDRHPDKANSQKKQQSSQNLAPLDKEYK
jgi:hypothetical protein